jgi:transcriptional regulator GlxA family with amidase domain
MTPKPDPLIVFLVYDGMTMLDLVGPFEVLTMWPDATIRVAAKKAGTISPDSRSLPVIASHALDNLPQPDIIVIPGGPWPTEIQKMTEEIAWLSRAAPACRQLFSVCTGSFLLAEAGLLRGRKATSHWAALSGLSAFGAEPITARYVEDGNILTAAGVSAGIDAALALTARWKGDVLAKAIQLMIEYDPKPPFHSGSPGTCEPEILQFMQSEEGRKLTARSNRTP